MAQILVRGNATDVLIADCGIVAGRYLTKMLEKLLQGVPRGFLRSRAPEEAEDTLEHGKWRPLYRRPQ